MTPEALVSLFNAEMVMRRGFSLVETSDFDGDPEGLRLKVEKELRVSSPSVVIGFWDHHAEMKIDVPSKGQSYCLLIDDCAPIRSAACH